MTNPTRKYVNELIAEEVQNVLLERRLSAIINQVALEMGVVLTEEQKKGLMQRLAQSVKQNAFGLAVGAITALAGGSLYNAQSQFAAEAAAQAQQIENSNIILTPDTIYTLQDFLKLSYKCSKFSYEEYTILSF